MDTQMRSFCRSSIRQALLFQIHTKTYSTLKTSTKKLPRNYQLRWIIKHNVFAGNRFVYALSDGSYAMLFDRNVTIMRSHGSETKKTIHHKDNGEVRDIIADFMKVILLIEHSFLIGRHVMVLVILRYKYANL